jgi:CBS domain-containing protein
MLRVQHLLNVKGTDVWCVDADEPVLRAIEIMAEKHIGALPVMRGDELVGMISERDYARKVVLMGRSSAETAVWEVMTAPVITVTRDQTVNDCMQMVTDRRIRHLPVVEKNRLVGMVSIGDLVRAVIEEQQQTIDHLEKFITG